MSSILYVLLLYLQKQESQFNVNNSPIDHSGEILPACRHNSANRSVNKTDWPLGFPPPSRPNTLDESVFVLTPVCVALAF